MFDRELLGLSDMSKNLSLQFLSVVPRRTLSRFVGKLMHLALPAPFRQWSILGFGKFYRIRFDEAERPYQDYRSIGDFFTRKLRPGIRPIESDAKVVHPADSLISQFQVVQQGHLIQAKGIKYSLQQFLTDSLMPNFGGQELVSMTYYLCPTDYHRVHSPVDGRILRALHVPGDLWPVNKSSVQSVSGLFAINERVILEIATDWGLVALVFVGATNVGQMKMSFDSDLVTNLSDHEYVKSKVYDQGIPIKRGEELGLFSMGSTVVMVYPKSIFTDYTSDKQFQTSDAFDKWINRNVLMGQTLVRN